MKLVSRMDAPGMFSFLPAPGGGMNCRLCGLPAFLFLLFGYAGTTSQPVTSCLTNGDGTPAGTTRNPSAMPSLAAIYGCSSAGSHLFHKAITSDLSRFSLFLSAPLDRGARLAGLVVYDGRHPYSFAVAKSVPGPMPPSVSMLRQVLA